MVTEEEDAGPLGQSASGLLPPGVHTGTGEGAPCLETADIPNGSIAKQGSEGKQAVGRQTRRAVNSGSTVRIWANPNESQNF